MDEMVEGAVYAILDFLEGNDMFQKRVCDGWEPDAELSDSSESTDTTDSDDTI